MYSIKRLTSVEEVFSLSPHLGVSKSVDKADLQNMLRSLGFWEGYGFMKHLNCDIHPCLCRAYAWTSFLVGHGLTVSEIVEYEIERNKEWKRSYWFMFLSTRTNKLKKKKTTKKLDDYKVSNGWTKLHYWEIKKGWNYTN